MSERTANPAPLGLFGFGITTVLLNFVHNAQLGPIDTMILAMGLTYGGLAQVIAGIMEYKKGNTFGTVAFTSYGLFCWSFVTLLVLPKYYAIIGIQKPSDLAMAAYFFMWGFFTFGMFFGTLKTNRTLQFVFMSLAILFFLLAAKSALLAYNSTMDLTLFTRIIGIEGIICGLGAVYLALAEVLNEAHGKTVLPICPVG
ncbi:MAG: acetate uptake transporter [Candidatus Bathyarchaeota archaeon]|nr:acetate uptake transporter [Candidatus Bathyarchaeota archaeon]MDH5787085.1 acetate uptake transporter [Candidatus Bathyarchaeota archaeon]